MCSNSLNRYKKKKTILLLYLFLLLFGGIYFKGKQLPCFLRISNRFSYRFSVFSFQRQLHLTSSFLSTDWCELFSNGYWTLNIAQTKQVTKEARNKKEGGDFLLVKISSGILSRLLRLCANFKGTLEYFYLHFDCSKRLPRSMEFIDFG